MDMLVINPHCSINHSSVQQQDDMNSFHKEFLVYGYIRDQPSLSIPNELSNLCLQYFDEWMSWELTQEEIQQFLSANRYQQFGNTAVNYQKTDVKWNIGIMPVAEVEANDKYSRLFVEISEFPSYVASITAVCKLCVIMDNMQKFSFKFCHIFTLVLPHMGSVAFTQNMLRNYRNVIITCYVDIINIKYNSAFAVRKYCVASKPIKLNKHECFQWNISNELLNSFRDNPFRIWQSESFGINSNWCLEITPNSFSEDGKNNNSVEIGLDLLRLPNEIRTVNIRYEIAIKTNLHSRKFNEIVDVNHNDSEYVWPENTYQTEQLLNSSSVHISVDINVLELFDYTDNQIEKNIKIWNKYGVIY